MGYKRYGISDIRDLGAMECRRYRDLGDLGSGGYNGPGGGEVGHDHLSFLEMVY